MADLAALLADMYLTDEDLAASSPYAPFTSTLDGISGLAVQAGAKDPDSLGEAIAYAAGAGLLGGLSSSLDQGYRTNQRDLYNQAMVGAMKGNATRPEDLDEALWGKAKQQADYFKANQALEQRERLDDLIWGAKAATLNAKGTELGKLQAYDEPEGEGAIPGAGSNARKLLSPIAQAERSIRKETSEDIEDETVYKAYGNISSQFEKIKTLAAMEGNAQATEGLINSYARLLSEGMVTSGDYKSIAEAQPVADRIAQQFKGMIEADGSLGATARKQILEASAGIYNSAGSQYQNLISNKVGGAQKTYGLDPESISIVPHVPYEAATRAPGSDLAAQARAFAAEAKAKGVPEPQARKAWEAYKADLQRPRGPSGTPLG